MKSITVGQIGKIITGNTPPRNQPDLYGKHIIFIKPTDISESSKYTYSPEECYSEKGANKYSKSLIPKGSTCVVTIGSIGKKMTMAHTDCFINQAMNAIIPNENYDNEYVYYLIKNNLSKLKSIDSGTSSGRENVSKSAFSNMELYVIESKDSQNQIGQMLSAYDDLIINNQRQIMLLEEAATRLYNEWFINLRFPGYETTPVVDGVPEGWTIDAIDSRISLLSGYAFKSTDFNDKGIFKIVTIKNVKDGQFDSYNVNRIIQVPRKMPEHCKLEDGDILLSLTGNVGRVCLVHGSDFLLNQRVAKLKSDTPSFAYCLFRSKYMYNAMNNLANGAAQQNLSPIRTGKIRILFPSEELLKQFEKIVQPIIARMMTLNKTIAIAAQARDGLLPKLMSGKIEV